mgnify:CR=1 FL=1
MKIQTEIEIREEQIQSIAQTAVNNEMREGNHSRHKGSIYEAIVGVAKESVAKVDLHAVVKEAIASALPSVIEEVTRDLLKKEVRRIAKAQAQLVIAEEMIGK